MQVLKYVLFFLIAAWFFQPSYAQDVSDYVSVGPAPEWVQPQDVDASPFSLSEGTSASYLLADQQSRQDADHGWFYRRTVVRAETRPSLEELSTITVDFDPSYQAVVFHAINITRNEVIRDGLSDARADVFRLETDRELLIYNGRLQLAYVLRDIRVGDIIDYSYSVVGRNPAISPNVFVSVQQSYGVPVQKIHSRHSFDTGLEVFATGLDRSAALTKSVDAQRTAYSWTGTDVDGRPSEEGAPEDHLFSPYVVLSTFETWADVGKFFASAYAIPDEKPQELHEVADRIKRDHSDKPGQLRAALHFVQSEIRYLGIELGAGGYIPRAPDVVLDRRFGDCKDMVILLNSLLDLLDIRADPLLVNLDMLGGVDGFPPSHGTFDHVITLARLDGKQYFLDPTRGVQLGDLDHVQQGDFRKGVIVRKDSPGMINVIAPKPPFYVDSIDAFFTNKEDNSARFTSVTNYKMARADYMMSWHDNQGLVDIEAKFLDYYQGTYAGITQIAPMQIEVFEDDAHLRLTVDYSIPNLWEEDEDDGTRSLTIWPYDLLSEMPKFEGRDRASPLSIKHPVRVRQDIRVHLEGDWELDPSYEQHSTSAFRFEDRRRFEDGVFSAEFVYHSKDDRIAPEDLTATMEKIKDIRNFHGIYLVDDPNKLNAEDLWLVYFLVVAVITLLWMVIGNRRTQNWPEGQIMYPVSVLKFLFCMALTMGFYAIFWVFKNWVWIRDEEGKNIWPIWRALFFPLTNFSLFSYFKNRLDKMNWFFRFSSFLAGFMLFVNILDTRWSPESDVLISPFTFVLIGLWIPVARQVIGLNKSNPEVIRTNSAFTWQGALICGLWVPITIKNLILLTALTS